MWAHWVGGGKLNIVDTCLDQWVRGPRAQPEKTALIWEGEPGEVRRLTFAELDLQVCRLGAALEKLGIERGDRVGVFLPMTPEVAVSLLAIAKIGAVIIPLFSGFGAGAVASRLNDAEVKVLICADGFYRRGQVVKMKEVADEALKQAPCVEQVVVLRRIVREVPWTRGRDHVWEALLDGEPDHLPTHRLDPEHPVMVIYTSGTTGRPKGAVHVHGGFPLKAAQDMAWGFDLGRDDVIFWITDIGWMMGPWLIFGALSQGATCVLYEGTPDTPGPDRLWRMVADVVDERGQSVQGEVGELVVRKPWPGMTVGFWRDRERYEQTYWSRIPGVWVHGDWAYIDPRDGLWYVLGRSDDTIKVAGKRLGPAEVESVLVGDSAVQEAAAVGVPDELKGEALVCFVVLRTGQAADAALKERLKERVASEMGKPLRPKEIYFVPDLPKTRNAKILRRVVKAVYLGLEPGDLTALENPDALKAIGAARA